MAAQPTAKSTTAFAPESTAAPVAGGGRRWRAERPSLAHVQVLSEADFKIMKPPRSRESGKEMTNNPPGPQRSNKKHKFGGTSKHTFTKSETNPGAKESLDLKNVSKKGRNSEKDLLGTMPPPHSPH
jgi:hypothetical protein